MLVTKSDLIAWLQNRRTTRRVTPLSGASASGTPTFNTDACDVLSLTGVTGNITDLSANQTGSPVAGDSLTVEITDNSIPKTIVWGSKFEFNFTTPLPVVTITGIKLTARFTWNSATSKWHLVEVTGAAVVPRFGTVTSSATPTINTDAYDVYVITALAVDALVMMGGTTTSMGQSVLLRVKDDGTARALTWFSHFRFANPLYPQPAATVPGQTLYMEFVFNNPDAKWDCIFHSAAAPVMDLFTPIVWPATTSVAANQRVLLPTGGLGYQTATRTTRSSFDATERAFWTFLPGGHQEQIAQGTTTWIGPLGITNIRTLDLLAGGAGGNGGGSATAALNQVGGPGGACGEREVCRNLTVVPTTSYTCAVGAAGTGGAGGAAAGNNPGALGTKGGDTTFTIGANTYRAGGGNVGAAAAGNSTVSVASGNAGGAAGGFASAFGIPGTGGSAISTVGLPPWPLGGVIGGAGGGPASSATSKGGIGGGARTAPNTDIALVGGGGSATANGTNGTPATELACGGGGGGGGCANGSGGNGGAGANGRIVIEF